MRRIILAALLALIAAPLAAQTQGPQAPIWVQPPQANVTQASVTCGTASSPLLAAGAAHGFIEVQTGNVAVWVNWAGATATAAVPSEQIVANTTKTWTAVVPQAAASCIAASATTVTLIYW